jgi:hypothetical protein
LKTSVVIFLLACLLLPFSGSYLFFHFKKGRIKNEIIVKIEAGLQEKDLIILGFTKEEIETRLDWKHSREFEFNGRMYDIVRQSQAGDSVFYTCYQDHKETRLNAEKEKLIARALGQDPFQKKQTERIKNFFNTVFSQDAFSWKPCLIQPSTFHYSLLVFHYSLFAQAPPYPPPKNS